jgi:hypothetical protein
MTVTPIPPPPTGTFTPQQGSYTPAPGTPAPPAKSGGCLKAALVGCSIILVVGAIAVVALVVFVFSVIKRSDVYREAYTRSASDPRVVAALGNPIEKGWWVMGKVSIEGNSGIANMDFPISGPKASARVHVSATRDADAWNYSTLIVRPDSGGEIDVLHH